MTDSDLDDFAEQFFIQLVEQTGGDVSIQVSMYDIGEMLGMDRDAASAVAQELMGRQLAEVRTLSGGIGLSAGGAAKGQELLGPIASDSPVAPRLGDGPLLTASDRQIVGEVISEIKNQMGSFGLDFESLGESMADLKTMEAQLDSPRPKTAIVRECLRSILGVVEQTSDRHMADRIRKLVEK